jgi:hypothetical protein
VLAVVVIVEVVAVASARVVAAVAIVEGAASNKNAMPMRIQVLLGLVSIWRNREHLKKASKETVDIQFRGVHKKL